MLNIDILVGSTLGGTEYVAEATQPFLEEASFTTQIHFKPSLTPLDINSQKQKIWLVCLATHGAGDYPDNFKSIVDEISQIDHDLSNIYFGIVAVGDSNYDTFCLAAKRFKQLLIEKGAYQIGSTFYIDVVESPIPEDNIVDWIPLWIKDLVEVTN